MNILLVTSAVNTSGLISSNDLEINFNVSADSITLITMPYSTEGIGSEKLEKKGIHITSNDPITVYAHQYSGARSEASIVILTQVLGKEYFVLRSTRESA